MLKNDNQDMDWVVRLISQVRSVRAEMNVPPSAKIPLLVKNAGEMEADAVSAHGTLIMRLARLSVLSLTHDDVPEGAAQDVLDSVTLILPLAGVIDLDQKKPVLKKKSKLMPTSVNMTANYQMRVFSQRHPGRHKEQKSRRQEATQSREQIEEALARFT